MAPIDRTRATLNTLAGSCLCGVVRFAVSGPFPKLYQCHCSLCRKQGGSVSNTGLIVAADKFRWISGEDRLGQWQRSSGFRSHFCQVCGSTAPNMLRDTGFVWVPSGLLDGDGPLEIGLQLYVGSKPSWDVVPSGGRHYESAPDMAELIELLHSRTV
jgi:hypothetical protein